MIATQTVPDEDIPKVGIVKFKNNSKDILDTLIEKPSLSEAPSKLGSYGRYLLDKSIFKYLIPTNTGKDGELWMPDAIDKLAKENDIYTHNTSGTWYTTGDPINMMKATLAYIQTRTDLKEKMNETISNFYKI